jgi:L-fuculose-phosphate aldolase
MNRQLLNNKLSKLSLSMFRKDFFGIYHGSISAKTEASRFIINTKEAIFDSLDEKSLIELYFKRDYRWNLASIDAGIHHSIYEQISEAKFICFSIPPFTTAYSLEHTLIIPKDYFGYKELGTIKIFDPKEFDNWYERAKTEIVNYMINKKVNLVVIKGYGIYAYNRDLNEIAKKLAILEKSCRLLMLDNTKNDFNFD